MWFKARTATPKLDSFKKKANLILITFDQWRGDWGDPNKPIISLPNIEKISRDGWTAERCYTSSPQCVPARISWLTGLRPSRMGVTKNQPANLPGNAPSFIRKLKSKGWKTAIVGKTHWSDHTKKEDLRSNKTRLEQLGFNESIEIAGPRALRVIECELTRAWKEMGIYEKHMKDLDERYKDGITNKSWEVRATILPNYLYPDIWVADKAIELLSKMPEDKPWILWVSFTGPHDPFDTPRPWKGKNSSYNIPEAIKGSDWIDKLEETTELKKIKNKWKDKLTTKAIDEIRCDYADHLQLLDAQVGKIMSKLGSRIDYQRTAVAITSDHGEMLGDHGMLYKSTFLEPSIRVPFIYREPTQNKKDRGKKINSNQNPIELTKIMKLLAENLEEGGLIQPLEEWSKLQKKAIAEFGSEIMIISKWIKVVFNKKGKAIWATNLKEDPYEKRNLLLDMVIDEKSRALMKKIDNWAKKDRQKKSKASWIRLKIE